MAAGRKPDKEGFWGPPTSTVDWCEANYVVSHYVAEFWNTVSNIGLLVLGIYGVRMCLREGLAVRVDLLLLFGLIAVVGVGSAAFHATLLKTSQQLDETPMVFAIVQWAYVLWKPCLPWNGSRWWLALIWLHNVAFMVVHWQTATVKPFQLYFTAWAVIAVVRLVVLYRTEMKDFPVLRRLIKLYVASWLCGTAAWLIDQHFCDTMHALPVNPQFHMFWHFAVGISSYVGPVSLTYLESRKLALKPEIIFTHGNLLPYVRCNVNRKT